MRAKTGNPCATTKTASPSTFFTQSMQPLYRFALRLSGSVEDAEDLASQAHIQAYRKGHRFRGDSSMRTWFFPVVMNEWRMLCRERRHLQKGASMT